MLCSGPVSLRLHFTHVILSGDKVVVHTHKEAEFSEIQLTQNALQSEKQRCSYYNGKKKDWVFQFQLHDMSSAELQISERTVTTRARRKRWCGECQGRRRRSIQDEKKFSRCCEMNCFHTQQKWKLWEFVRLSLLPKHTGTELHKVDFHGGRYGAGTLVKDTSVKCSVW